MPKSEEGYREITKKQRDVLQLLTRHMTSKEIARELDISPHTVDQRIRIAKEKLGATSRSQLVARYLEMEPDRSSTYGKPVYEDSDLPQSAIPLQAPFSNEMERTLVQTSPMPSHAAKDMSEKENIRVVPKLLAGRRGRWFRIAMIGAIAVSMLMVGLAGLAMFNQLSDIFAARR